MIRFIVMGCINAKLTNIGYFCNMKRIVFILTFMMVAASASAVDFDKYFTGGTLRLDYVLAGDASRQEVYLQEICRTGEWAGRRSNLDSLLLEGNSQVLLRGTDGALLYAQSFSTLFQEWLTTEEAESLYCTTKESLRTQAYRRHIPTKREYGTTYYSKIHLDEIFRPDLKASDAYYTTAEAAEKYGMTKSNICVIVKTNHLTKVKVGVRNLIVKEELDRIMESRLAQFGAYRLQ